MSSFKSDSIAEVLTPDASVVTGAGAGAGTGTGGIAALAEKEVKP